MMGNVAFLSRNEFVAFSILRHSNLAICGIYVLMIINMDNRW